MSGSGEDVHLRVESEPQWGSVNPTPFTLDLCRRIVRSGSGWRNFSYEDHCVLGCKTA